MKMTCNKIRALVADDSAFMRRAIRKMLEKQPDIEVVAIARDGKQAVEFARKFKPDVITLDIEMPEMDGLTALRYIMRECPTQVLMVSSLTTEGSNASLQALRMGAADVIGKDHSMCAGNLDEIQTHLIDTVRALARSGRFKPATVVKSRIPAAIPRLKSENYDIIAIGSSTGGPPVLEELLTALPERFPLPIVIAQHMPRLFTESMSKRLENVCKIHVVHAHDDMLIQPGCVYIAPGGEHIHVEKRLGRLYCRVNNEPSEAIYTPSVTALLESCARATGKRTLAAVLTGLGADGCEGAIALHQLGATVLAQDEASSVVYGMPRAVAEAGVADAQLAPKQMGQALAGMCNKAAA